MGFPGQIFLPQSRYSSSLIFIDPWPLSEWENHSFGDCRGAQWYSRSKR